MSVVNIRPVESGQSKAVIGIAGQSGDGKTLTALYIARGMVSKPSEIGFLDAENKRGSLYADALEAPFMIGDLYPPFSPNRFAVAIKQFQDAGTKVLIVDSISHAYEGEGGLEDIANAPKADGTPRKVADWVTAKREWKKLMNVVLQSNMDIIFCIRAREKVKVEVVGGKQDFVSQGLQPICEKNFMFEMTASIMMGSQGKIQEHRKVPTFLKEAFGDGKSYLGIETGKQIRAWLDKGKKENPEITRFKSEALLVCEQGVDALTKLWNTIPKEFKSDRSLKDHFALCGESAKAYDAQNTDSEDFDKLEKILELFELKKSLITKESDINFIKQVVETKDEANYDKIIYQLNKLKNE